ncbi:vinorine synthase-like [Prunus yedoensis var. nudiflora]|uniref:Vinorine synthase-like n=1 Tax=Prunus yedoensis var. nudiflora TaxID=2094558 RepID=A0A314XFB9_PRUYE|nr:vinorine synthase-like [Prunus yedoensis var. nudiflora]
MPFELDDISNSLPLGVQLNIFQCGGFAIGQCISHKIADGLSYFMFSKIWAAVARGDQASINPPEFVSSTLFPPKEFNIGFDGSVGITKDRVTKRFVFDASQIENLRERYEQTPLRIPSSGGGDEECGHGMVIPVVREAIGNIDNVYVTKLQKQGDEHLGVMKKQADSFKRGEMPTLLSFSSYCRFPLYDNDFGWGRPTWVGSPALTYKNLVLFMDTKEGGGIEAYVSLEHYYKK